MKSLCLFFAIVLTSQFLFANDDPITGEKPADIVKTENAMKRSVRVYVKVQRLLAGDKHKTLAVELLEIEHGKTKRCQNEALGDVFVDITPYIVGGEEDKIPHDQVLSTSFKTLDGSERFRKIVRLANEPAIDAAQLLNKYFESEVVDDGDSAPTIKANVVMNSLIVESNSKTQLKQIATMIEALDVRPPMFKGKITIGRMGEDGKIEYMSRPSIMTIENLTGKVSIGATRIDGGLDGYSVELTMRRATPE